MQSHYIRSRPRTIIIRHYSTGIDSAMGAGIPASSYAAASIPCALLYSPLSKTYVIRRTIAGDSAAGLISTEPRSRGKGDNDEETNDEKKEPPPCAHTAPSDPVSLRVRAARDRRCNILLLRVAMGYRERSPAGKCFVISGGGRAYNKSKTQMNECAPGSVWLRASVCVDEWDLNELSGPALVDSQSGFYR